MAHNPFRKAPFGGWPRKKASSGAIVYRPLEIGAIVVLIDGLAIYFGG